MTDINNYYQEIGNLKDAIALGREGHENAKEMIGSALENLTPVGLEILHHSSKALLGDSQFSKMSELLSNVAKGDVKSAVDNVRDLTTEPSTSTTSVAEDTESAISNLSTQARDATFQASENLNHLTGSSNTRSIFNLERPSNTEAVQNLSGTSTENNVLGDQIEMQDFGEAPTAGEITGEAVGETAAETAGEIGAEVGAGVAESALGPLGFLAAGAVALLGELGLQGAFKKHHTVNRPIPVLQPKT